MPSIVPPRRFVRITFQECEEPSDTQIGSSYATRGLLQDIRLMSGWFRIADDHSPAGIAYEIIAGELHERATSTLPGDPSNVTSLRSD